MGGWTIGILFGVVEPSGLHLRDDYDGKGPGLLDKWEKVCARRIKALEKSGKLARYEYGTNRFVPDTECCANVPIMGFWVAAGASGKPGCPNMPAALALTDIEHVAPYAAAVDRARLRWRRFARWARKQGVKLPRARLMLAQCEVA